jgi:hypothetical protein
VDYIRGGIPMKSIQLRLDTARTESKSSDVKITTFEDLQKRVKRAEILLDHIKKTEDRLQIMDRARIHRATLSIEVIDDDEESWRDRDKTVRLDTYQGAYMTHNQRVTDLLVYVLNETLKIELEYIKQELRDLNVGYTG